MSVAEDSELRDLVSRILEENGVLAKIRAELRANVFLALEESAAESNSPFINRSLKEFMTRSESALSLCLVREFLEFLQLDNTLAVFNSETQHGKGYEYKGHNNLVNDLHLEKFKDKKGPLLSTIIRIAQESLGSSNTPHKNEQLQAGDFLVNNQSPKTPVPSNISYTENSNVSLDNSHTALNQTFTTGTLVTSFGSPDASLEKQSLETGFQSRGQPANEKKPPSGGPNGNINSKDRKVASDSRAGVQSGDGKNLSTKEKPSTNPQISLSNLPPISELKGGKNYGTAPKNLLSGLPDDNYEEDISSESSGAGEKDSRGKSDKSQGKKVGDAAPDKTSIKDNISPVASVSEELEGDTNSVTDDVNSAASADTLDSSLSYLETKFADHMEEL